uniref:Uncharacterized protein n=1 Tax=Aegilops tauschii TaxID=37682 RepID=R7W3T8_AEGTA
MAQGKPGMENIRLCRCECPALIRALKNLCGKISREQTEDDVRKIMEVFAELGSRDLRFTYRVQADKDGRIINFDVGKWEQQLQYTFFGDVVTTFVSLL